MQVFLVGGAVRDQLLGMPVKERDWVVVGATPAEMIAQGYRPVGKDFPVFLHPDTHEEYALARTERKSGKGYKGFTFHADASVSLEQDLRRRDLTINAIAQSQNGDLIDPYHGQRDLEQKTLRHVSVAFAEDPVRILRLARFASKLPEFTLHSDTLQLMCGMVDAGEVDALVAERVWKECVRALGERQPRRFFEVLQQCTAFDRLFTHIEFTGGDLESLDYAVMHKMAPVVRWGALLVGQTAGNIKRLLQRYKVPTLFRDITMMASRFCNDYVQLETFSAQQLLKFVLAVDLLRRPERFLLFSQVCQAHCKSTLITQVKLVMRCEQALKSIDLAALHEQGLQGKDFANALYQLRIAALEKIL